MIRVVLAQPRGFCAGVERAIEIVERALKKYGPPIYVRHEIVHNRHVVEDLRTRGAVFVDELDEIPPGAMTVFSAHGVAKRVEQRRAERSLPVIDATCPLVAKVHNEGRRYAAQGREIVLVGHAGHAEVEGTIGQVPAKVHLVQTVADVAALKVADPDKLAYITQTTLSVDDTRGIIAALKARFPTIVGPDVRDICYATQNRQQAVRDLAGEVDMILVVGSRNSSNSNRLREIGEELGKPSYLIDDAAALRAEWFDGVGSVGVTAGASAPEMLVQGVLDGLRRFGEIEVSTLDGVAEDVRFRFPAELAETHKRNRTHGRAVEPGAACRRLCREAASARPQALSAGADAGAAVPLQPGLRRLRQDRLSGRDPEPAPVGRRVHGGGRRMRRAGGGDRRRRAAAASRDRPDRRGRDRAQEVRHRLHQRAAAGKEDGPVQAEQVVLLVGAPGRRRARNTTSRSARTGVYDRAVAAIARSEARGFRTIINCTLFNNAEPENVAAFFDDVMAMGVDGISVSPGYAYERAPDQQHFLNRRKTKELFRGIFAPPGQEEVVVQPVVACSWTSWPATRPSIARRGAIRPAPISAGSGPAICWARAMPRPSRS